MSFLQLEEAKEITIKWQNPISYDELKNIDEKIKEDAYLYKIIAIRGTSVKLLYIGKCYSQYVSRRLFNDDHKKKYEALKDRHKGYKIHVSIGIIDSKTLSEITLSYVENLLIYAHTNNDFPDITNKRNSVKHNVLDAFVIYNKLYRADKMYKKIGYGVYYCK